MTSKIKVDNINKVSDDSNIIKKCGTTITLGASGDSIALASGASQTGFGRTGAVDWQTASIKTATFTAVNGEGYFCNTTGGSFEVDLPAGSPGAIVSIQDYNNTFDTNSLIVDPNGSEKINGGAAGGFIRLSTEGLGITFVYIDATVGWRSVDSNEYKTAGDNPTFITATGGTPTTDGNFKVHTFTGPGTFTVCSLSSCAANNEVSYIVVAAGGGGGKGGGGGGAGGFRESKSGVDTYSPASPLEGATNITVTATSFPITVGAGGAGQTASTSSRGASGGTSTFSTVTSAGGGGAGSHNNVGGKTGGSGGGNSNGGAAAGQSAKAGNTPPVSPPQGQPGGASANPNGAPAYGGSGGGGAGATGGASSTSAGGAGGAGVATSITGSAVTRSGGGGGSVYAGCNQGAGGSGGGGAGGPGSPPGAGTAGTANTGGGGGGGGNGATGNGATGGSGIVIIRYKFQ